MALLEALIRGALDGGGTYRTDVPTEIEATALAYSTRSFVRKDGRFFEFTRTLEGNDAPEEAFRRTDRQTVVVIATPYRAGAGAFEQAFMRSRR